MAKLNIEELVSGLLEAALVASSISERQHINALRNYFDDKGNPKTTRGPCWLNCLGYLVVNAEAAGLLIHRSAYQITTRSA